MERLKIVSGFCGTQLSFKELEREYEPRRPEQTVLYQAVAQNFRTFEAMAEIEGKNIPKHVTAEFKAFLKCGILAHGFLRVVCSDCKHEKLCRYIARPAVAEDRLSLRPSGDIVLKLKTPYSDGTSHLFFSGLEFV